MKEESFDRLVGMIYESALNPGLWQETMRDLARQVQADAFHLLGWNSQKQILTLGVIETPWCDGINVYRHDPLPADPSGSAPAPRAPDADSAAPPRPDPADATRRVFHQDFWLKYGLRYVMGGCLARSDSTDLLIGLMRAPERGHFTAKQEIFLTRLMPHFNRALRLMEHTRAAAGLAEPAPTPDDATAYVLIALDKSGRLLYCNPRGEALLTAAEVLRRERTAVSCPDSPQNTLFADAIAVTVQTGRPGNLLLHNPMRPAERYSVTLIPLPERGAFSLHGSPDGVLCLMAPLDCRRVASVPQLMRLFGLTDAEARLACALATGETLASYAREHALAPAAVNRQVRTVFEKTDTRALADLVRLLTRLPAA